MSFEVKDRAAAGRIGVLRTPHGDVSTPTLLPVINPNLRLIAAKEMRELFGTQMIITNSYVLRKHEDLRERALRDGVHKVIDWDGPIMTDSGTFQSYMYGKEGVGADEIIDFQKRIGVDVGTILDVFTTPDRTHAEASVELEQTLRRAADAAARKDGMMLAGTVQGGIHLDLRERAAAGIAELKMDVAPIGGVVPLMEQGRYATLARIILASKRRLPSGTPVHLFGAGHPLVFPLAVALGCDLFDSASYAKYAKDGRMMFPWGTRALAELSDLPCPCPACDRYKTAEALRAAPAPDRERALAEHNLHVSFSEIRRIRQAIRDGTLWELVEERAIQSPGLLEALAVLREPPTVGQLEALEPTSSARAFSYKGPHSLHRPLVGRLHGRLLERYRIRHDCCYVLPPRTRPYGDSYQAYLPGFVEKDATFVVETPFGPVPLELDLVFPIAQSLFPERLDEDSLRLRQRFSDAFLARFEGCDVLPYDFDSHPAATDAVSDDVLDAFDARRVHATADHQFGPKAGEALLGGALRFVRSPNNRRVRNIFADGAHVASLRAEDGLLSLRWPGAGRIHAATPSPRHRLVLEEEPAGFVSQGKNIVAKYVKEADPDLRPGDDCLVVDTSDRLVATARMILAGSEVGGADRGFAAKNTGTASDVRDAP